MTTAVKGNARFLWYYCVDHCKEKLPLHYVVTLFGRYLKKAVFGVSSAYIAYTG